MRKVFESLASHEVGHCESILTSHGIPTTVKNQSLSSLMGEIPFAAVYPELWVLDDDDHDRATALLAAYRHDVAKDVAAPDWTCPNCRQPVPDNFSACWNCSQLRGGESSP